MVARDLGGLDPAKMAWVRRFLGDLDGDDRRRLLAVIYERLDPQAGVVYVLADELAAWEALERRGLVGLERFEQETHAAFHDPRRYVADAMLGAPEAAAAVLGLVDWALRHVDEAVDVSEEVSEAGMAGRVEGSQEKEGKEPDKREPDKRER